MLMLTWRCNYGGAVITSIGECFFYIPSGELEMRSPKNALNTTTIKLWAHVGMDNIDNIPYNL